ncbi:serine/threonine-protein kinase [Streptomyces sp. H39-C1]|uniref:serine/threonine-protein kinase n=1 Tax=Streptomyces sp. H39-C1 TaxID=3004355 RepID=UPI0022AEA9BE|nr:serine/threonine-protein kinase [Streptomyces sp. H39-C1]MCZ4098061.1 protein kinase [Streptomyces sp. H39-C1]
MADEVTFIGQSGKAWRYWESKPLGKPGGFGGVYEAEGPDGSPMAVKVVPKEHPWGRLDDRLLQREVHIGKRVAESGSGMLLPVIDAADAGDSMLLVMQRAQGVLASGPMAEAEAVTALVDIATGLQDLHSIPITHRDLKPANVLRHEDRWKLGDFGIARDEEIGTGDPTFRGAGTLPYMAPELWELKSPTVKTDLYALGCLAFELLAGVTPFTGDRDAIRDGHLNQTPPDAPCSDTVLKNLIRRLLAKRPEDRPQDARAVVERLSRVLVPRTPVQEAIARGLGAHAADQARAESERLLAQVAEDVHRQQGAQAKADLREIMEDALTDLQAVEPSAALEVRETTRGSHRAVPDLRLTANAVRLRVDLWEGMTTDQPVPNDTMVLAGCVVITNPSYSTELTSANVVYEQVGDRLVWQIYKFRSGMVPREKYRFGPYGRTHGFQHGEFFNSQERYFMLHPALHVWNKTVEVLTAETLLNLFQEAVDLRPPDPRTGLWS